VTIVPPKIDTRLAPEVLRDIHASMPAWYRESADHFDTALLQICARFGELIIDRLNKAPEKNFLAFLDLLGLSPLLMEAARVPVTFFLAPGSTDPIWVPAGTQVAAPPAKGAQRPVFFETERDLFVTPARLDSLLYKDGTADRYANLSAAVAEPSRAQTAILSPPAPPVSTALLPIPHLLYIALPLRLVLPKIDRLCLNFTIENAGGPPPFSLQWEVPRQEETTEQAAKAVAPAVVPQAEPVPTTVLTPSTDGTRNLTQSGSIVFLDLPPISNSVIAGIPAAWIACRLLTPVSSVVEGKTNILHEKQLPVITNVTAEVDLTRKELPLDYGFANNIKLDLTKDFLPFGERPKIGDTFYLAHRQAFSDPDVEITLHVQMAGPAPDSMIVGSNPGMVRLGWDFWDGQEWMALGTSGKYLRLQSPGEDTISTDFSDQTESFSKSGEVKFRFNRPPAELTLNGMKNYWLRARIVAGDYGREAQIQRDTTTGLIIKDPATGGPLMTARTLAPPIIRSIRLDYDLELKSQPKALATCNDFSYARHNVQHGPFRPFRAVAPEDALPALYLGFSVASPATKQPAAVEEQTIALENKIPNSPVSAYVAVDGNAVRSSKVAAPCNTAAAWEYWNSESWRRFAVTDGTLGFQRSGMVEFPVAADFTLRPEFGRQRYWARIRQSALESPPQIRHVYLNTTLAIQGATVLNDLLGSSTGEPKQKFRTTQAGVLAGQKLDVREPTLPPAHEQACIRKESGNDAIQVAAKTQCWVRWKEVTNFYGSGPRDRHYVLDHVSGKVSFGDGVCGMVPPVLDGNIRMTCYRVGGGTAGNVPAGTIKQLVSAIPSIQKVINPIAAEGGSVPETRDALLRRGPREIRHGDRAVTAEDYEDLAMRSSRQVARAKCVPLRDLKADSEGRRKQSGVLSVIIVPNSIEPRPVPSPDLLDRVQQFLDERRSLLGKQILVAPEYVCVDVKTEIVVERARFMGEVERGARNQLDQFLHPVSGGADGMGWGFGCFPQKFDLYVLFEKISGVSHVRNLQVEARPCRPGMERTGWFLVCSGHHEITLRLEEEYADGLA
jgi:hypothetical protein